MMALRKKIFAWKKDTFVTGSRTVEAGFFVIEGLPLNNARGFTLVEAVVAMGVSVIFFGALLAVFLGIKSMNASARSHAQAIEVVRGAIDQLKGGAFNSIGAAPAYLGNPPTLTSVVAYDAGADNVWGTPDDLTGNLRITVADLLDMDNDGVTNESFIDIDTSGPGGVNDPVARPVRVSFTWNQPIVGLDQVYSVSIDTLIGQ